MRVPLRGQAGRASSCFREGGAFEVQRTLELARRVGRRVSGEASDTGAGLGSRQPGAVELSMTLESEQHVRGRANGTAFEVHTTLEAKGAFWLRQRVRGSLAGD